jgi:hypothetical protein
MPYVNGFVLPAFKDQSTHVDRKVDVIHRPFGALWGPEQVRFKNCLPIQIPEAT